MEYIIGIVGGLAIAGLAKLLEYDKDRSFYPVILIVIAMYYVLFSVMGNSSEIIIAELIIALAFMLLAIIGHKTSLILVAIGLIAHGVFDLFHDFIVVNPEIPAW